MNYFPRLALICCINVPLYGAQAYLTQSTGVDFDALRQRNQEFIVAQANDLLLSAPYSYTTDSETCARIQEALLKGASVDYTTGEDDNNETALMRAASKGFINSTQLLITQGANIHLKDINQINALGKTFGRRFFFPPKSSLEVIELLASLGSTTPDFDRPLTPDHPTLHRDIVRTLAIGLAKHTKLKKEIEADNQRRKQLLNEHYFNEDHVEDIEDIVIAYSEMTPQELLLPQLQNSIPAEVKSAEHKSTE